MKFSTAIEFMKNGYFVADEGMRKMDAAIGFVEVPGIDDSVLVIRDVSGMETFALDSSIIFGNKEWYVAIEDEFESTYNYYVMDDSSRAINFDMFDEALGREACDCGGKCNCTTSEKKKEDEGNTKEKLLELQKNFLLKTTQLVYESDLTKKMELYNELADIATEIQELEKEVR